MNDGNLRRFLVLALGAAACATAVIQIRESRISPALLASARLGLAAVFLLPFYLRDVARHGTPWTRARLLQALIPAAFLWLHFLTWALGARMIPSAHAVLVVNLTPVVMPLVAWLFTRETPSRVELVGTAIGMVGVWLLVSGDLVFHREAFAGDLVCFGSMLLYTMYVALGRRNRDAFPSVFLYLVPLYALASAIGFSVWGLSRLAPDLPFAVLWSDRMPIESPFREWLLVIGVALIPTVVGHGILNWSLRAFSAQLVSLVGLSQFLFAGLYAWLLWSEWPKANFLPAAAVLVAGIAVVLVAEARKKKVKVVEEPAD